MTIYNAGKRHEFFDGKCSIKNCELPEMAAGFCNKHWRRLKKYGSPLWLAMPAGAYRGLPIFDRFSMRVLKAENGCWNWQSGTDQDGYGLFMGNVLGVRFKRAHRFSWAYHNQKLIPPGMEILHSCDNPRCVNPEHLSLGTALQNQRDKWARGRGGAQQGESHWKCRLTEAQVREIRASKEPQDVLAARYGITQSGISGIIRRRSWAHLN